MATIADTLTTSFGAPIDVARPRADAVEAMKGKLPQPILDAWKTIGWCGFGEGLLWLTNPEDFRDVLQAWEPVMREVGVTPDAHVFLRGAFGHLFLWFEDSVWSFDVLGHVGGGMLSKVTGEVSFFVEELLPNAAHRKVLLEPLLLDAIVKHGTLSRGECYTFSPPPGLGGKMNIGTLGRGRIREYLKLVAQAVA